MKVNAVFENEYIIVHFSISEEEGQLNITNRLFSSLEINFRLNQSFEITYDQALYYFGYLSNYDISCLLDKTKYKLIHLKHYDAYVIVEKDKKIPTIYVPEDEIRHVIGSGGSNINSISATNGYKRINVKAISV